MKAEKRIYVIEQLDAGITKNDRLEKVMKTKTGSATNVPLKNPLRKQLSKP